MALRVDLNPSTRCLQFRPRSGIILQLSSILGLHLRITPMMRAIGSTRTIAADTIAITSHGLGLRWMMPTFDHHPLAIATNHTFEDNVKPSSLIDRRSSSRSIINHHHRRKMQAPPLKEIEIECNASKLEPPAQQEKRPSKQNKQVKVQRAGRATWCGELL